MLQTATLLISPLLLAATSFAAGTLAAQLSAKLPDRPETIAAFLLAIGLLGALFRVCRVGVRMLLLAGAGALLGWGYAAEASRARLAELSLPDRIWEQEQQAEITILNRTPLPAAETRTLVALIALEGIRPFRARLALHPKLAQAALWLPGKRYRATLRLAPLRAYATPGAFDREWWAFRNAIAARGTILSIAPDSMPDATNLAVRWEAWRVELAERLAAIAPQHGAWLRALALGDRTGFDETIWELVRSTGTAHLVAISGMHVALLAWLAGRISARLWRLYAPFCLWIPAPRIEAISAVVLAWFYVALAGFGLPALRAALMLSVVMLMRLTSRFVAPSTPFAAALTGVLLLDPFAILDAGFWLSFVAVAILALQSRLAAKPRSSASNWLQQAWLALGELIRLQLWLTLALMPWTLLFFGEAAAAGSVANLFAIPLVAWIATPVALVALFWPSELLGAFFDGLIGSLLQGLSWAASLPGATITLAHLPAALWALVAVALFWALAARQHLVALAALLLPFAADFPPRPEEGSVRITMLDVGQGQAIHIQTARHELLYDAGPAIAGWNAAEGVILPYLRTRGVERLDALIVSHADADHAGGSAALFEKLPITRFYAPSDTKSFSNLPAGETCQSGTSWSWDGVRFTFLWPDAKAAAQIRSDNDRSCVLLIENGAGKRFLVAGDISASVEALLLAQGIPRVDAVVVSHHGSRTSSSEAWVAALAPNYALLSVGANRFGHPSCAVLERYRAYGAEIARTDRDGAITLELTQNALLTKERSRRQRFWHRFIPERCHEP